jgi:hypothetical protein
MKFATHLLTTEGPDEMWLGILGFYLFSNCIHGPNLSETNILVQMTGHELGVDSDEFNLQLNIESKPKGTDFRCVSWQELEHYTELVNAQPRKRLDYRTPAEVFEPLVAIEN